MPRSAAEPLLVAAARALRGAVVLAAIGDAAALLAIAGYCAIVEALRDTPRAASRPAAHGGADCSRRFVREWPLEDLGLEDLRRVVN